MHKRSPSQPPTRSLEKPTLEDAASMRLLAEHSGSLDLHPTYTYLLCCSLFRDTCRVVRDQESIVGFVTGLRKPRSPEVLFVWQVGVLESARGQGLGKTLILDLIKDSKLPLPQYIEATVAPENSPSLKLFQSIAKELKCEFSQSSGFEAHHFGSENHSPEHLIRVGPIKHLVPTTFS